MGRIYTRRKGGILYGDWYTPDGERVQRSLKTRDRSVAKQRLRESELAATAPQARVKRQRLSEAINYMIVATCHDRAKGTREMYEQKGRRIAATLGDPWIDQITRDMISEYIAKRLGPDPDHGGAAPHTVQKELITIRRALREAHERGLLPIPPPMPRFSPRYKPRETWLTPDEFELVAANLGRPRRQEDQYSAARRSRRRSKRKPRYEHATPEERVLWASVAALAGASASEVESLDWSDVDLAAGWLKLRGEKRETRARRVPIAPALAARLLEAWERAGSPTSGRVVKRWTSVRHCLHRACDRAGIGKRVSPNDLRRTFGSWLVQRGADLLTVATLMGHSSTRMVERVYGRLSADNLRTAIAKLPSLPASSATSAAAATSSSAAA